MICPYNGFKECDWEHCQNACQRHFKMRWLMKVCAIAYNGGEAPKPPKGE